MQQTLTAKLAQLTIAVACASMLAACGGGGSDNNTSGGSGTSGGNGGGTAGGSNTGGGSNTDGGGSSNAGGGSTGSGSSTAFDPSSEKTVAEDNAKKTSYGGKVTPVSYVLHNQDHTVVTLNGQRYGDATDWLIDLEQIQLKSTDGGDTASWSGSLVKSQSKFFAEEGVLMACAGTWDKFTNIAIDKAAEVISVTDIAKLAGTYTEYSCGTEDIKGEQGAFSIDANGVMSNDYGKYDAKALMSPSGLSPEAGLNIKARGYIINGIKVIIMKDTEGSDKSQTVAFAQ